MSDLGANRMATNFVSKADPMPMSRRRGGMARALGRPCDGRVESGLGLKVARSFACPGFAVGHATRPSGTGRLTYRAGPTSRVNLSHIQR